jgi:competence protein ComEA
LDEQRKKLILLILAVVAIGGISFFGFWQKNSIQDAASVQPAGKQPVSAAPAKSGEAIVYISGAVNKPGVYKVPAAQRVVDAVNTAGGLAAGADVARVNLAQQIKDGMHIYIPLATGDKSAGGISAAASSAGGKININTADKATLEKLPGIGPALADRMIDYRQTHGAFQDVTDLRKVSGIGEAKYNQIKDKVSL